MKYIVVEHTGTPADGKWLDMADLPGASYETLTGPGWAELVPTGEIQFRDDGERAEVYAPRAYWEDEQ